MLLPLDILGGKQIKRQRPRQRGMDAQQGGQTTQYIITRLTYVKVDIFDASAKFMLTIA